MNITLCRNPSRVLGPIGMSAALACVLACLVAPAAGAVTYAHMIFDDEFQNMWKNGSWRAEVDTKHSTRVYNGTYSVEATLKAKGALCFSFEKGRNLKRHHALVGWIHGGSEGAQNIRIVLTDIEGNILPSSRGVCFATPAHIQGGKVSPRRWQFFVIPLSELKPGYRDTTRIAFYNPTKETMPTFYLDDVGFTVQKVQPFSSSGDTSEEMEPVAQARRGAQAVYTDTLKNGWENWSWNTSVELNNKDNPAQGKQAILVEQEPSGGLGFGRHKAVQIAGYSTLSFYINGGQTGGQQLSVSLFDDKDQIISTVLVSNPKYVRDGAIAANLWQQVAIPLADLHVGRNAVSKIAITNVGSETTTYYVDAVSLVK